jgi:hypothetical protein
MYSSSVKKVARFALRGPGLVVCLSCVSGSGSNEVAGDLCTFG